MENEKELFKLNDRILFRKCSLFNSEKTRYGDCTNFDEKERNYENYYYCNQYGIHFHCAKHSEIEFETIYSYNGIELFCKKCGESIPLDGTIKSLAEECLRLLNMEIFKDAKLVRLDDWYVKEVKDKTNLESDYFVKSEVKTDKDGDTIVVIYVGYKGSNNKIQYFIKPEKAQLTNDHKDLDPAKILSKIELTLRDRKITHDYN